MFNYKKITLLFVLSLYCITNSIAQSSAIQPKGNSPYSRFGLGDFLQQNYASTRGMAGLGAAFSDAYHLNIQNPASLAALQSTAFEVGLYAKYSNLEEKGNSASVWTGNLGYLALGFPLINPISRVLDKRNSPFNYGMSLALTPYTTIGYDIRAQVQRNDEVELTTNIFKGTGGTYRLTWGNGAQYKDFSAGVTLGYLFGKLTRSRSIEFDSLSVAYSTESLDETSLSGFVWNAGVQYTRKFGKIKPNQNTQQRLTVGVYGNSATNFRTNSSQLYQRILVRTADTLLNTRDTIQRGTLPSEFTAGIQYEQPNKLRIGAEYTMAAWNQYRNEANPETLVDANRLAIGLEYIPEFNSYNNYFNRVRYRLGFSYATDPRRINGEQLKESVISLGFGFPIVLPRQQVSFVNLAIEGGQFGLPASIKERFIRMTLGFTLNDNTWFFKRKFG